MHVEEHEVFRQRIDESLAAGISVAQDDVLREHLRGCAECEEYLSASTSAIVGLSGFSFEVDPALSGRVVASLARRAEELRAKELDRRRVALGCMLALLFTAMGSLLDLQFGRALSRVLDVERMAMRLGLLEFWIVPSVCLLLVFPLLPLLSEAGRGRKERVL